MHSFKTISILLLILFPSFSAIEKISVKLLGFMELNEHYCYYGSMLAVILYILICGPMFIMTKKFLLKKNSQLIKNSHYIIAIIILVFFLFSLFFVVYPLATSGTFGGGSDRDEALNIAVNALLDGEYPYYKKTFVPGKPHEFGFDGNPISPFPGELLLSLPFVILGNGAYQIFFWIFFLAWLITLYTKSIEFSFGITLGACIYSVGSVYEIISGGDLLVNGIWIFSVYISLISLKKKQLLLLYFISILFGIALSTRPNFLLITPFAFGLCSLKFDKLTAIKFSLCSGVSFLVVTLPFYLYDKDAFSPLHAYSKIGRFDVLIPYSGILIPALSTFLAIGISYKLVNKSMGHWFISMAIILFIPVLSANILDNYINGRISFIDYSWYGLSYLYFIIFGYFTYDKEKITVPTTLR